MMAIGDRVLYVGDRFEQYYGKFLVLERFGKGSTVACKFPDPDRPGGFGLTTWLELQDLLLAEVPAQL
jgi:hypothetical protein